MIIGVDSTVKADLDRLIGRVESNLGTDVVAIYSPILPGVDARVRAAIENLRRRRKNLTVILDTPGGVAEIVERIVNVTRHFFEEVNFLVPDRAMSAGTILAMSGDRILMDYFSCLGPVDPQIEKDGKLIPALSYLTQYQRMVRKAQDGELTTADMTLLSKLDLAELHQFEQAKELSMTLLKKWLVKYKFKNWVKTESQGLEVTEAMRVKRAEEIAAALNNHELWHSHGRGIPRATLREDLKIKVDDFETDEPLRKAVGGYHALLRDYCARIPTASFVHSKAFF